MVQVNFPKGLPKWEQTIENSPTRSDTKCYYP